MSPALVTKGLGGGYGRLQVFAGADLSIGPGQTLGILGPNGAGKTTLLKTIMGLLPASAGWITLFGRDLAGLRPHDRVRAGLALVPEGRQIITELSVRDNLELSRAAGRLDVRRFAARRAEVLDLFPRLQERLAVPGGALSGGEQQMLAIARALLLNPAVLLLDEPTQGLAPIMVRQMEAALLALRDRLPMVIVEQNRGFLEGIAGSVMTMREGRLRDAVLP